MGLISEEGFTTKVVQLKEIMEVRHCVFVIGPAGCGKSAVWKCLAKAHTNKGEPC
jgi:dynein heavy chain